jgi:hypothetical protein
VIPKVNITSLFKNNISHGVALIKTSHVLSTIVLTFLGFVIEAYVALIEQNWEYSAQTAEGNVYPMCETSLHVCQVIHMQVVSTVTHTRRTLPIRNTRSAGRN